MTLKLYPLHTTAHTRRHKAHKARVKKPRILRGLSVLIRDDRETAQSFTEVYVNYTRVYATRITRRGALYVCEVYINGIYSSRPYALVVNLRGKSRALHRLAYTIVNRMLRMLLVIWICMEWADSRLCVLEIFLTSMKHQNSTATLLILLFSNEAIRKTSITISQRLQRCKLIINSSSHPLYTQCSIRYPHLP